MANPDFNVHTPAVAPDAIANIMARRSQLEQQKAEFEAQQPSKFEQLLKAVQTGQSIAQGMMNFADKRQDLNKKKEAAAGRQEVLGLLNEPLIPSTFQEPSLDPKVNAGLYTMAKQKRNADFEAAIAKMDPDEYSKQKLKAMFDAQNPDAGKTAGGRYQQSQLQAPNPKTGQMETYSVTFDRETGQNLNPQTLKPITSDEDLQGLVQRGYAQTMRPAGFTVDGKEVVADARTGNKYVTGFDAQGNPTQEKFDGTVFPKLENIPQGFADSLGELSYSQDVLNRITTTFNDKYVGPVAARAGKMKQYVGELTKDEQIEFYGNVAEYKNSIIKAITGAQMSEVEAKRIVQQIPDENASPQAFMAAMKRTYLATNERIKAKERALAAGGYVSRGSLAKPADLEAEFDKKMKGFTGKSKGADLSSKSINELTKEEVAAEIKRLEGK